MSKFRRIPDVVEGKRIDSEGWVITRDNGESERIPDFIFKQEWELVPDIQRAVSKTNQSIDYVVLQFAGTSPNRRMMSLDMIRRWDVKTDWEPVSAACRSIISSGGTFLVLQGNWLIFEGKTFLFHCDQSYFEANFELLEEE